MPWMGGGYFASLQARAASHEPRASVCEPQKNPAKKSKNGHNALIWHLLHAGYFIYVNTRGTFYQTTPTKGNRTLTILIPFPNSSHKRSRAVNRFVKNRKANFGSPIEGNPKYSGEKKPKQIFHYFRDLWHNENTSGLHVLVHCSMASEVVEIFPLFLYFFQLGRYYRKDIFPILLFRSCSCERVKRKCRDSVAFQKLTARITRFVNICNRRHE